MSAIQDDIFRTIQEPCKAIFTENLFLILQLVKAISDSFQVEADAFFEAGFTFSVPVSRRQRFPVDFVKGKVGVLRHL